MDVAAFNRRLCNHLNVLVKSGDVLLLSKAWRYLIRPESVRLQGQLLDLDERVGEIAILHQQRALTDPNVQRAGQFSVVAVFSLRLLECLNFYFTKIRIEQNKTKQNFCDGSWSLSPRPFFPLIFFYSYSHAIENVLAENFSEFSIHNSEPSALFCIDTERKVKHLPDRKVGVRPADLGKRRRATRCR